jgi:hypothetical protein
MVAIAGQRAEMLIAAGAVLVIAVEVCIVLLGCSLACETPSAQRNGKPGKRFAP